MATVITTCKRPVHMMFSLLMISCCMVSLFGTSTPNIVFILADDMGYGDVEPYSVFPANGSHAKLATPNLVRMASEGMLFTDAYCGAPVCAPSRCTLMTGVHSGHCDVRANGQYLNRYTTTVATMLSDNGYDTALFGKWGLGAPQKSAQNDPVSKGFGTYYGQVNQANCHNYYPYMMWMGQKEKHLGKCNHFGTWCHSVSKVYTEANANASKESCGEPDYQHCIWTGDVWQQSTLDYLKKPERKNKPFYVFLSFTTPHSGSVGDNHENDVPIPRVSTGPYWQYNNSWPRVEVDYATAVYRVDEFVGQIMDILKEQGLEQDTIVMFASDNGASNEGGQKYKFFQSSGPLTGFKRSLKEGGHRTPFIVKWPGVIEAGSRSDYQWTFYDFMATAADLAGISESDIPETDGMSVVPTLLGQDQGQKEWVYHEYCGPTEYKEGWGQAVRMGNYTGLCIGEKPNNVGDVPVCDKETGFELYDLTTDLQQTVNIAKDHQQIVDEMWKVMIREHSWTNEGEMCGDAQFWFTDH